MFDYVLELPIQLKDAKSRGLRRDIAKLLVMAKTEKAERESSFLGLAQLIYGSRNNDEVIHALPISGFASVEDYKKLLIEEGVECHLDAELDDRKKKPRALLIECDTEKKCFFILKNINAEAILFYSTKRNDIIKESEKRLVEASVSGYIEKTFLKESEEYGFFIFFAESHMSLEILGTKPSVVACFAKFLELENNS
jgi:hypothetical protein